MPSFELSKLQAVTAPRALSDTDRTAITKSPDTGRAVDAAGSAASETGVAIEVSGTVDTAAPPVDTNRVQEIRAALREGTYPLVPTKIADAVIAAQFSYEGSK